MKETKQNDGRFIEGIALMMGIDFDYSDGCQLEEQQIFGRTF